MATKPFVIIGAGQCGLKALETLRQSGYKGELILIGDEPCPPYQRPPLSKSFLKGKISANRLYLKADSFYHDHDIDVKFGVKADKLDAENKVLTLSDGHQIHYEKLLIATGSMARNIPLEGSNLENVYTLRTINDGLMLSNALRPGMKIAIIGAGYIGLEVAASLRGEEGKGVHEVTVIEAENRILARIMAQDMSDFFETLHTRNGVKILTNTGVKALISRMSTKDSANNKVKYIQLQNGDTIACDIVLLAVGALPVVELAQKAGLEIDNGIKVDHRAQTSDRDIFAAGDCASFYSKRYHRWIRLESVQNAIDQGKIAAQAMLDHEVEYDPLPWFWSDQYDIKLQIVGLSQGFDRMEINGEMSEKSFSVTYFKDDRAICVDAVNQPRAHMMARRTL